MATLRERIDMLKGELSPSEMQQQPTAIKSDTNEVVARLREAMQLETDPIKKQALQNALKMYLAESQKGLMPNSIESNIAMIQQQTDDAIKVDQQQQEFMKARQDIINEVFTPLANEGYQEMVNTILTKPMGSEEHNQAVMMMQKMLQSDDPEFDMQDFGLMIQMVSREPRPADLINPEGLPDSPPKRGIGSLQ